MGQDTYGYDDDRDRPEAYRQPQGHHQPEDYQYESEAYRGQPEAYWRRRVITLCAGLTVLAVLAWAFTGSGKAPSAARKASPASSALPAAAYSGSPSAPSTQSGSASAPAGSAASLPFPAVTSGSGQPKSSAPSKKAAIRAAAAGAGAGNAPPGGVEPNGSCAPGSVVLSLFSSRTSYSAGQLPAFQIYAVSTASRTCSFDVSPHRLHVQVTSSGRVIWDSADCTKGEPNRSVRLRRGVPTEASVTWRRNISLPGCVTVASSARAGSYQVQARDTAVASPVRNFKLIH
jgi:hypothetical protein